MKKLLIVLLLAAASTCSNAQTGVPDTLAYLQTIVANKAQFLGKPFYVLEDSLKIRIKFFSPTSDLVYNTSKETSTNFGFYFPQSEEEMYLTYPHLIVVWQSALNAGQSRTLYRNSAGWSSPVISHYASGIIADIKIID